MSGISQDIRYAVRSLLKAPGFAAVAVLTLALGIGANTAIFTVVNAVFFHPLVVDQPRQLVQIYTADERNRSGVRNYLPVSHPNGEDLQNQAQSFSSIALFSPTGISITIAGRPERLTANLVTGSFFDVLGIKAAVGRTFILEEDSKPGAGPVVVLSDGIWKRKFGGDTKVINQTVLLNGQSFTIVGVTPPGFQGTTVLGGPDLWIPMSMHDQVFSGFQKAFFNERRFLGFSIVARLKNGVDIDQARAELRTIGSNLERQFPLPNKGRSFTVLPLLESSVDPNFRGLFTRAGQLMMAVVGLVLLIACANIANLLLVRASGRRREISIRLALGASRFHIIRQLLTEAMVLAGLGSSLGLGLAWMGRNLLWNFRPPALQASYMNLDLDYKVLLFTLFVALAAGVICGLAPAMQFSRPDLVEDLKERVGGDTVHHRFSMRQVFVVVQVALSLVALTGAGLFLVSLHNVQKADFGFDAHNLEMLTFDLGSLRYDPFRITAFHRRVLESAQVVPGVQAATLSSSVPFLSTPFGRTVIPEGQEGTSTRNGLLVQLSYVDQDYLQTMKIPLLQGRNFDTSTREDSHKVAIINELAARQFWPNQDPIGKRFKFFGSDQWIEVIGVARGSKYNTLGEDPISYLYLPLIQYPTAEVTLFFRGSTDPAAMLTAVRNQVQALDRNLPLTNVWSYSEVISQGLWATRFAAGLLSVFAFIAVVLCAVGIHGVVGYSVGKRSREIGIRMALGAQPSQVLLMVLQQSAVTLAIGLVAGISAAILLTRLIVSLLYGVDLGTYATFIGTAVALAFIGLLASYIPARRAARIDPLSALHYE